MSLRFLKITYTSPGLAMKPTDFTDDTSEETLRKVRETENREFSGRLFLESCSRRCYITLDMGREWRLRKLNIRSPAYEGIPSPSSFVLFCFF